jgi:hypothetical protein
MPQSFGVYGEQKKGVQPWISTLGVGKSIFDYYDSHGDVVSSAAISIPSVQDGPGVVARYKNLTLNHVLTTTNRCRSLTVLVDGDLTIKSGGGISMTARGARGNAAMGMYDGYIPASIDLVSKYLRLADVLQYVRDNAIDLTDRWFWDDMAKVMGVTATFNQGGALVLLTASGCGSPAVPIVNGGTTGAAGTNGGTGSGGCGNFAYYSSGNRPAKGRPWGGGPGSGGSIATNSYGADILVDDYGGCGGSGYCSVGNGSGSGAGAGAGNPSGTGMVAGSAIITPATDGTGGILRVIVKGTVTINSGGIIQADGSTGGSVPSAANYYGGGGGSGGGHVSLIFSNTFTQSGTIRANGGAGGTASSYPGGAGGAGSVVTKTFIEMGW